MESSSPSATGTRALAWVVLAAALLEVVAPVVTINGPGSSPGAGSGPDLLITPAGWAFSIWGVIYTAAIVQAVVVLVRGAERVPRRLQVDQGLLYAAGAVWIVVAGLDSAVATAAVLLVMLLAALDGVLTVRRAGLDDRLVRLSTLVAVGLYAGWVTAAFFLNVSTALVSLDATEADALPWQLVVLAVAVATLAVVTVATRGNPAYVAAGCWAMLGIAVTGASDGTTAVWVVAACAAVLLLAVALVGRRIA